MKRASERGSFANNVFVARGLAAICRGCGLLGNGVRRSVLPMAAPAVGSRL
jgi:hypothetical protein